MSTHRLFVGSTNIVELLEFQNTETGDYIIDGSATATLTEVGGVSVTAASAIPLDHVPGTVGRNTRYRAVIPHTVQLIDGTSYILTVPADDATGDRLLFAVPCIAVNRL